mmetsp:Transcript_51315/g.109097  ORF Transcript_51315/g.109097 Transcript_51315/m.109097 type:complete len:224 (+) Transcript_51315:925-1596(+)
MLPATRRTTRDTFIITIIITITTTTRAAAAKTVRTRRRRRRRTGRTGAATETASGSGRGNSPTAPGARAMTRPKRGTAHEVVARTRAGTETGKGTGRRIGSAIRLEAKLEGSETDLGIETTGTMIAVVIGRRTRHDTAGVHRERGVERTRTRAAVLREESTEVEAEESDLTNEAEVERKTGAEPDPAIDVRNMMERGRITESATVLRMQTARFGTRTKTGKSE